MPSGERSIDVLLVGGGVAAVRCARMLRRQKFDGSILLIGDEPAIPYNRPPLSKELLRDELPDELVAAEPASWYERRRIELRTGAAVETIDPTGRRATLRDGTVVRYERCLLATGATPRRLPIPGAERALLLRTLSDARHLREAAVRAGPGAPVVVIGAGFIGVEIASGLAGLRLKPTIVEIGERLWSGRLGTALAEWGEARLRDTGVVLRLRSAVSRIDDDAAWIGDERLPAAFVVAGIGVRPRDDLARDAGLDVDDGIVVDAGQRTSDARIWAAGDVARRGARRVEHWHAARESGQRAALGMLGHHAGSAPEPWVFTEVAGTALDVVGDAIAWDEERWIIRERVVALADAGRVVQMAAIDSAVPAARMREIVAAGTPVERVEDELHGP
jgi:NADPH-dependent 2,4-dienoyl-CoA reductase/sulfur reductase-like enzyme